jgi:hypothetical protein
VNLLLAILLSFGAVAKAKVQPPVATANFESHVTLTETGDNAPALNGFLAQLPAGVVVTIPAGTWQLHSPLLVMKRLTIEGPQTGTATFKLIANGITSDVLKVGDWLDPPQTDMPIDGFVLRRITLEVGGNAATGLYNCLDAYGGAMLVEDCVFKNCPHEGVVTFGGYPGSETAQRPDLGVVFRRCKAINCGFGNTSYGLSTAGFNGHSNPTIYEDCETDQCCQGFEVDGHHSRLLRCTAKNPSLATTPVIGINVGSTGKGIWDIEISGCTVKGYETAIQSGNGIGRFASLNIHHCTIDGGGVYVMGGEFNNQVITNPVSPDTGQSHIDNNVFIVRTQGHGAAAYQTPPWAGAGDTFGREPFTFNDNAVFVAHADTGGAAYFAVTGKSINRIEIMRNVIFNSDAASVFKDIRLQSNNANTMVSPPLNIFIAGNLAFKKNGDARPVETYSEGQP